MVAVRVLEPIGQQGKSGVCRPISPKSAAEALIDYLHGRRWKRATPGGTHVSQTSAQIGSTEVRSTTIKGAVNGTKKAFELARYAAR